MVFTHKITTTFLILMSIIVLVLSTLPAPRFGLASNDASYQEQEGTEPITFYTNIGAFEGLDPQATDLESDIDLVENLFLGLTDFHPITSEIRPELATDWSFDVDTNTWTFTLRDDVPWVRWDPATAETIEVRPVVAGDFVTGIRHACDPRLGSQASWVIASLIAGCDIVLTTDPGDITPELFEQVQVWAPDDTTLMIALQGPIGYFFSLTPLWILRAVPGEIIEEWGSTWTDPGIIVTNGPYVLDELGDRIIMLRNPLIPDDLVGPGNVERVTSGVGWNPLAEYPFYLNNQLDISSIPAAEQESVLSDPQLVQEVHLISILGVYHFWFNTTRLPFDNVHVRRAFNAAFNRQRALDETQGVGEPMMHFTPPGMFGAPPITEIGIDGAGIGYDPEFARAEMAAAGYPNCEGFPPVNIVVAPAEHTMNLNLAFQLEITTELGCDPDLITLEFQDFLQLRDAVTDPDMPNHVIPQMWMMGAWFPDYPDAHNWLFDAGLHCESSNRSRAECTAWDDLIRDAQFETDPDRRRELYHQAEEMMFGYGGEFRMMPIFLRSVYILAKPWVDFPVSTDGIFGGQHFDWITIDQATQLAARGD